MPARGAVAKTYPSYRVAPPKLVGGALCLDFVNTLEWRGAARGERLVNYDEFLVWAEGAGAIDGRTRKRLEAGARARPDAAAAAVAAAIALRETLADLLHARAPRPALIARLNAWLERAPARLRVAASGPRYDWAAADRGAREALLAPLWPVAWSAADLLTSGRATKVRACADRRCAWLFVDDSRSRHRRWCSMEGCGNRAKARRHYRRHRAA